MPPDRTDPTLRRLSAYNPYAFNPLPDFDPADSPFYSWPLRPTTPPTAAERISPRHSASTPGHRASRRPRGHHQSPSNNVSHGSGDDTHGHLPRRHRSSQSGQSRDRRSSSSAASSAAGDNHQPQPTSSSAAHPTAATRRRPQDEPRRAGPSSSRQPAPADHQLIDVERCVAPMFQREPSLTFGLVRPPISTHILSFVLNQGSATVETVIFKCMRSQSTVALVTPPPGNWQKTIGDVHVHVWDEGIQYWVFGQEGEWRAARVGSPHPTYGKSRVLSHRPPHTTKLPAWVLDTTLVNYRSRARRAQVVA